MTKKEVCEAAALVGAALVLAGCWWLHPGAALVVLGAGTIFVAGRQWQRVPPTKKEEQQP